MRTARLAGEAHLESELRAAFTTTADPSDADFYLLPACLSQHWAAGWTFDAALEKLRACITCTHEHETALLDAMRSVGDFYERLPHRHLMVRHKCPRVGENPLSIAAGEAAYASLWHTST